MGGGRDEWSVSGRQGTLQSDRFTAIVRKTVKMNRANCEGDAIVGVTIIIVGFRRMALLRCCCLKSMALRCLLSALWPMALMAHGL